MRPDVDDSERQKLRRGIAFHRALNLVLGGGIIVVSASTFAVVMNERTFLTSPESGRTYEIGRGFANKEYLLDQAHYVLGTILTVTPETVEYNNGIILKMVHPDGYPALRTTLDAAALRVRQERITTVWIPRKEVVNTPGLSVKLSGTLKTWVADKPTSTRDKDYMVQFMINNSGRLYVKNVQELVPHDAAQSR